MAIAFYVIVFIILYLVLGAVNQGLLQVFYLMTSDNKSDFEYRWYHYNAEREMMTGLGWAFSPLVFVVMGFLVLWQVIGYMIKRYFQYFFGASKSTDVTRSLTNWWFKK